MLAATDPAQPYGAALAWPKREEGEAAAGPRARPARRVVLAGTEPVLYLERGGRALQTLVDADDPRVPAGAAGARRPRPRRPHQDGSRWRRSTASR